jgi:peptidoglycan/LPS O-acetylase OafA/YrhL
MSRSQAPLHIPSLDGIRAISFLLVFFAHAGLEAWVPGGLGVTIFFFLSGFLITSLMRVELAETGGVSFKHFYLRRALRILPPFYVVLLGAAALALVGILPGPPQSAPLLAQIFHFANYWTVLHGYEGEVAGTGVYWSLAVEEHFYLLFPAVFVLLHRILATPRARAAFLWGVCALVLAWRCALVFGAGAPMNRTYLATDTRVDSILFGCALALAGNPALDGEAPGRRALWLRALLPAGAALMLVSLLFRDGRFRETFRYSLQGLALVPLFVCAVRNPRLRGFRLLNHPLLRRIGELSYSLYLLHHVVISGVQRWVPLPRVVQGAMALGLSFALSMAIWRWIEQPCARLRKRLTPRAAQPAPGLAVAVGGRS